MKKHKTVVFSQTFGDYTMQFKTKEEKKRYDKALKEHYPYFIKVK